MSGFWLQSPSLMATRPIKITTSTSMPIDEGLKELSALYICKSKKLDHSGKVLQRYQGSKIAQYWWFMCNISCFFVLKVGWIHWRLMHRSNHRRCSTKEGLLKNFDLLHLCKTPVLIKFRPANLLKRDFLERRFTESIAKFLKTSFSPNTSGRPLLNAHVNYFESSNILIWSLNLI